jgi:hypothetical protein
MTLSFVITLASRMRGDGKKTAIRPGLPISSKNMRLTGLGRFLFRSTVRLKGRYAGNRLLRHTMKMTERPLRYTRNTRI